MQLVHEDRRIFGSLNVEENLVLRRSHRVQALAARSHLRNVPPGSRSGAAIAAPICPAASSRCWRSRRALVRDPKIILLDEPFEGLAPIIVRDLVKACSDLAAAGQTIVLVEQNLAATLTLAKRIYIINNGHVVHEGPAQEIKAQPEILQRYLGV